MNPFRSVAHLALAGIFISGGLHALKHPKPLAGIAKGTVKTIGSTAANMTGIDGLANTSPEVAVRANGAAQVLGGAGLALGFARKPAALGLICSLIPTTVAGHPFWKMSGHDRENQKVQFLKNLGLIGGLLLVVAEGRRKPLISIGSGTQQDVSKAVGD